MRTALMLLALALVSCKGKPETEVADKPATEACTKDAKKSSKFQMYEMSEMSMLMERMYADNQRLKDRIIKGDTIGKFPDHFLEIHKAVMTDDKENDAFFKAQAQNFLSAQHQIYEDPTHAREHFNNGVDACVKCHEVKCAGPIARIKKLYIK